METVCAQKLSPRMVMSVIRTEATRKMSLVVHEKCSQARTPIIKDRGLKQNLFVELGKHRQVSNHQYQGWTAGRGTCSTTPRIVNR